MELFAETVFTLGLGTLAIVHFASVYGSLSFNPIEMLKVFFIPGYSLMTAWKTYTWMKPVFISGCGIALVGLILLEMV